MLNEKDFKRLRTASSLSLKSMVSLKWAQHAFLIPYFKASLANWSASSLNSTPVCALTFTNSTSMS